MAPSTNAEISEEKIPVVDLKDLYNVEFDSESCEIKEIAENFGRTLHNYGFAYVKNHGIPQKLISDAFAESKTFFELPTEVKLNYAKTDVAKNYHGYTQVGREILNSEQVKELRESYDITKKDRYYPTDEVPGFQTAIENLEDACRLLDTKLVRILAMAVKLDDIDFFLKCSQNLVDKSVSNLTTMRTLYYPPIDESVTSGQITRCQEHSDYGIITLLFQDTMGGLEVKRADEKWISADPIPDTILINIGDNLEAWTGKYFPATPHRVIVPESEFKKRVSRQSIAFFLQPDDHIEIETLSSEVIPKDVHYPRVNAYQYSIDKAITSYS